MRFAQKTLLAQSGKAIFNVAFDKFSYLLSRTHESCVFCRNLTADLHFMKTAITNSETITMTFLYIGISLLNKVYCLTVPMISSEMWANETS